MSEIITIAEEKIPSAGPYADFSYQINLGREKVEKKIFSYLCDISKRLYLQKKSVGALVVLGCFDKEDMIPGMRQLGNTKIEKYINVAFGQFESDVLKLFETGDDGAIIINQNGQILGTGIYLTVDNPSLVIPEGCGCRHIAGSSCSTRSDVLAVFTLSEETSIVRMWKEGHFTEQYNPADDEVEVED